MGFLGKLREALKRSRDKIVSTFKDVFKRKEYDDSFWEELEETFILADMGPLTAERIVHDLKKKLKKEKYIARLQQAIIDELTDLLNLETLTFEESGPFFPLRHPGTPPLVVMVLGVNGTGKTSFVVKLAKYYKDRGLRPIIGACDTYRAAAIEQLEELAKRAGVDLIKQFQGADAAAVAFGL